MVAFEKAVLTFAAWFKKPVIKFLNLLLSFDGGF
jgi:hypothetical protein